MFFSLAVDMVTASFRPIQQKLDDLNKPANLSSFHEDGLTAEEQEEKDKQRKKEDFKKRRKLLVDIGDHIRLVLHQKFGSGGALAAASKGKRKAFTGDEKDTGGRSHKWWEEEMWEYAARYLPLGSNGRMLPPAHLADIYKKYKRNGKDSRVRKSGRKKGSNEFE